MEPTFFATPDDFRAWLEAHHDTETELLVGFHKKGSGRPSITWPESVDQALCFGWIDGVRRRIDDDSYTIRFTPRKPRSTWSAVNVRRVDELTELGAHAPGGRRGLRAPQRRPDRDLRLRAAQDGRGSTPSRSGASRPTRGRGSGSRPSPPCYRRTATYWVISAKRPETRERRLEQLIEDSAAGPDDPLAHAAVGARRVRRRASVSAAPATAAAPAHSTAAS